jgi:hypothetical protein
MAGLISTALADVIRLSVMPSIISQAPEYCG